ncbi:AzlD domain-containing protein [Thalassotalea sp. PP2-459]|uniref:AzlD domain-containing protein n=1 Tax=Thalassotalea sp. PP2-459 TaxID=1742724 RepID=UPI0009441372|nr:AzlD domain-containing protein [Thalassotalea sp. PP2-459]OKY27963.1 branched-chain amino acid ABC transporter [Thalassotalea sp. PP2-459]
MTLLIIVLMAMITFLSRYLFLHPSLPLKLSPRVGHFLSFSAPAVLTAIWVPIIFIRDEQLALSVNNPYLIAGITSILCAYRFKSIYLTLGISCCMFMLIKFYF